MLSSAPSSVTTSIESALNLLARNRILLADFGISNDISNITDSAELKWTINDRHLYYQHRVKEEDARCYDSRGGTIRVYAVTTELDDYQLTRDKDAKQVIAAQNAYKKILHEYISDNINNILYSAEQYAVDWHLILSLLVISSILRNTLRAHDAADSHIKSAETPPAASITINHLTPDQLATLIARIDAIHATFANYLFSAITDVNADLKHPIYKDLLDRTENMLPEIFPWLSIQLKEYLVNEPPHEDKIIKNFCLLESMTIQDRHKIRDAQITTYLKNNKMEWKIIENQPLSIKLRRITKYLQNEILSDSVALKICQDLVAAGLNHGNEASFIITSFNFLYRVREDNYYLPQCKAYIINLSQQLRANEDMQLKWLSSCHVNYAAIIAENFETLHNYAVANNLFIPMASLFYRNARFVSNLLQFDKQVRIEYLNSIFNDNSFLDDHLKFITSPAAAALEVDKNQFPLLALHLYYAERAPLKNVNAVWEAFLDNDNFMENNFFANEKNLKLFENLQLIYPLTELPTSDTILANAQRYKKLALALCIYRSCYGKPGWQQINYQKSAEWARNLYANLMHRVAYPDNSATTNFSNMVTFLDLKLSLPYALPIDENEMASAILLREFEFNFQHPDVNPRHINQLISVFLNMYLNKTQNDKFPEAEILGNYSSHKMPTQCIQWLDYPFRKAVNTLPVFASRYAQWRNDQFNIGQSNLAIIMFSITASMPSHSNHKSMILYNDAFGKNIFYAYCQINSNIIQNSPQNSYEDYQNFILNYESPKDILITLSTHIETVRKHHKDLENTPSPLLPFFRNNNVINSEKNDLSTIIDEIKEVYTELIDPLKLDNLLGELTTRVNTNKFNTNYITTNVYHTFLINMLNTLLLLKEWQLKKVSQLREAATSISLTSPHAAISTLPNVSDPADEKMINQGAVNEGYFTNPVISDDKDEEMKPAERSRFTI